MVEQLRELIEQLKRHSSYITKSREFPYKWDSTESHIALLVDQSEKILRNFAGEEIKIAGYEPQKSDVIALITRLIDDAHQYLTTARIDIDYRPTLAQSIVPAKALFHVARADCFKNSYATLEIQHQLRAFEEFSSPFPLRLALEGKLKNIFGFKSAKRKTKEGAWEETDDFKVSQFLRFLRGDKEFLRLPCSPQELLNIYRWACRFTHTGQKQYIWVVLKALERTDPLFDFESNQLYRNINVYTYLRTGKKLKDLERKINGSKDFESYRVTLDQSEFEIIDAFYDKRTKKHL